MESERRRAVYQKRISQHHIKEIWETHQTLMKYRDYLSVQWRAPHFRVVFPHGTQADYKVPMELKSCLSEFHHKTFDVAFIKEA